MTASTCTTHHDACECRQAAMEADIARLQAESDEARAKLAEWEDNAGDLDTLKMERDEARANYRWMVEHAADEKLDGYRELGARAAAAENERDALKARAQRAVEAAYRLGAKDAQRLAAGVLRAEYDILDEACRVGPSADESALLSLRRRRMTAGNLLQAIEELDPTRAMPALDGMLTEPGQPCRTCGGEGAVGADGREVCPDCNGQGLVSPAADFADLTCGPVVP